MEAGAGGALGLGRLTVWTEVGAALGDDNALDGRSAPPAGRTLPAVDIQAKLILPLFPIRIAVVPQGSAAVVNGLPQNLLDGGV